MNMISNIINKLKPERCTLGLEITDHAIKLVELSIRTKKQPWLRKYQIEELPDNAVVEGRINDTSYIAEIIKSMLSNMCPRSKNVHIVLPSQLVMVRFLKLPDIPMKDLRKVVEFEIKHNIHLPFDRPVYDFIKLNGIQDSKTRESSYDRKINKTIELSWSEAAPSVETIENTKPNHFAEKNSADNDKEALQYPLQCDVMLIAAPQDLIEEYVEALKLAKLNLVSIEIKALSLFRLIEFTGMIEAKSTFILADITKSETDITIYNEGQLKITRNLPLSFPLQEESPAIDSQVDLLFTDTADTDSDFMVSCNDLAHELERLMNFYRYTLNHRDHEFKQIVLTGDVSRLNELSDFLGNRLSLDIVRMHSDQIQIISNDIKGLFPILSVPMGLALRGSSG